MGSVHIVENCLAPEKDIFIKYTGPNPWQIVEKIGGAIRPFFHVSSVGTNNERLNWDRLGENIEFFSKWWVKKGFSGYTHMRVELKLQGFQNKNTGEGKFSLKLFSKMETRFTGWSLFVRPVWQLYSYIFYNKLRRQYLEKCRDYTEGFRNLLKEEMGLKGTTHGPPKGSSG